VADLDGVGSKAGKNWDASVTISVVDAGQNAVTEVTVGGAWSEGSSDSCLTDTGGLCSFVLSGIDGKTVSSVTFTVNDLGHVSLVYQPADNTDPDGDSDGTSITINKP
jgi:hypothetical protein